MWLSSMKWAIQALLEENAALPPMDWAKSFFDSRSPSRDNRDKKAAERSTVNKQPKFADVPGTYVFTKEYARKGYHLNMFCMSLNVEANRDEFRSDEAA